MNQPGTDDRRKQLLPEINYPYRINSGHSRTFFFLTKIDNRRKQIHRIQTIDLPKISINPNQIKIKINWPDWTASRSNHAAPLAMMMAYFFKKRFHPFQWQSI